MASTSAPKRPLPALVEHAGLRFVVVFLLYVAQGVPVGLFFLAVPAWMALNKASAADIGLVLSATSLPWTLKLINGVIMDRFAFPPMGRRRPWIIGAQTVLALLLAALAMAGPAATDTMVLAAFAFAVNVAITFQDVGIDGLACDVIPPSEQSRANGFMFGGQSIGISAGTGIGGSLMVNYGIDAAALAQAAFVAVVLVTIVVVRERPGERLLPWQHGSAAPETLAAQLGGFGPILRSVAGAMLRRDILIVCAALICLGTTAGLFAGLRPLFAANVIGWTGDELTRWTGIASLVSGLFGALVVGFVAERFGARRLLMIDGLAIAATGAAMLAIQSGWADSRLFVPLVFASLIFRVIANICGAALAMRLVSPAIAATQFSLFTAFPNLGDTIAGRILGPLHAFGGIPALFAAIAVCGFVSTAILAFASRKVVGD
jgi:PAT family beta-lactamase induction signal transducer AmpG